MRSLRQIAELYPEARTRGLSEAQVLDSRERFGANRLTPLPRQPAWKKFLAKFDEPIIKILLAASLLKIVVDLFESSPVSGGLALGSVVLVFLVAGVARIGEWVPAIFFGLATVWVGVSFGLGHPSVEGLAVMVAVFLATGVAFVSEHRSDREFEKLNAAKDSVRVKVIRDGSVHLIPLEDVVVGDLVVLEMGDEIPADGRVVRSNELMIDQSLMTGESELVKKSVAGEDDTSDGPDQPGCLFRATQVGDGVGQMVVTNVGDDTVVGQIARRLTGEPDEPEERHAGPMTREERIQQKLTISKASTPLQEKLAVLAGLISRVGYVAAVAIFLALLVRGAFFAEPRQVFWPHGADELLVVARNLLKYFVYMVIIIVVAVPEGLPMSVTVSLALAWRKMSKANSLVRQLVACETIGSATVICSDKTGTLTQNKMAVARLGVATEMFDGSLAAAGMHQGHEAKPGSPLHWIILNSALNSTASLEERNGKVTTIGNSTEGALLNWLRAGAWFRPTPLDYAELRANYPVLHQIHFSSDRKRMTSVVRLDGRLATLVKGAPEQVLSQCEKYLAPDGRVLPLTDDVRAAIRANIAAVAGDAMRTLAFAHVELPADFPHDEAEIHRRVAETEQGLVFDGFVGIRDPLRDDVKEAIEKCRAAGIEVKMITGDTVETARAIGREIDLLDHPDAIVMTHDEFDSLTDEELKARLPRLRILARAMPKDKYRMVRLLRDQNHVVGMTGDGTNDAPALKLADVGLAMGISGTEVAKEASKIVLLDDAFSTIVRGIHWGRSLYENIQRFVQFQLTINLSALVIAFLSPFLGLSEPPFTVLQLLWINVIMDTFAAIALCSEPPREGLMRKPPKRRDENILTPAMLRTIFVTAGFFVVVMITLLLGMKHQGWFDPDHAGPDLTRRQLTIFFTVYVFFQVWNQINCRSLTPEESGLYRLFDNPQFLMIASLIVIGQLLIVNFGGEVFNVVRLSLTDWLVIAAATSSVLVFAEIARRIRLWLG